MVHHFRKSKALDNPSNEILIVDAKGGPPVEDAGPEYEDYGISLYDTASRSNLSSIGRMCERARTSFI
jgi:hypothetical protein